MDLWVWESEYRGIFMFSSYSKIIQLSHSVVFLLIWANLSCDCVKKCIRHRSNYMLTIEGIFIAVKSGCSGILFSDLNLTPHFQQWQYSNCFEKSWLSFSMISKYHHPPYPPHSTKHPVYLQWSAITDAFRSLNHETYLELLHHCQTGCSFLSMAPDEQGLLFWLCNQKETLNVGRWTPIFK